MHAKLVGIEYSLPQKTLNTADLTALFPAASIEAVDAKTGIRERHLADNNECASDLAVDAANRLFGSGICRAEDIDYLMLCTQSPDYALPTTACLLQNRLGIRTDSGAIDYNLGCSGFVYGLGISEGLISSGQAETVLLITAETYSKYLDPSDKSSRAIFGDGAAATLIRAESTDHPIMGPFLYGTDGKGAEDLIVRNSGARLEVSASEIVSATENVVRNALFMNGPRVFSFAVTTIPLVVKRLLRKAQLDIDQIDLFVFHQANAYLMEEIRRILEIPTGKFYVCLSHCANTVSSTIPIALKHAELDGILKDNHIVMLVGWGVGYSWSGTVVRWNAQ